MPEILLRQVRSGSRKLPARNLERRNGVICSMSSWAWASVKVPVSFLYSGVETRSLRSLVASFDLGEEDHLPMTFKASQRDDSNRLTGFQHLQDEPATPPPPPLKDSDIRALTKVLNPGQLGFFAPCIRLVDGFRYYFNRPFSSSRQTSGRWPAEFWLDDPNVKPDELILLASGAEQTTTGLERFLVGLGVHTENGETKRVGFCRMLHPDKSDLALWSDVRKCFSWRYVYLN